jgi:hypothetical protein
MAELEVTLPASWFTSKTIYDLERRAVFLKVAFARSFKILTYNQSVDPL